MKPASSRGIYNPAKRIFPLCSLSDPILAVLFIYVFEESATQFVYPMPQFLPMPWFVSITEAPPLFARSLRILLEFPTSTSRFGFISSSSQGINHHTPAEFALAGPLSDFPSLKAQAKFGTTFAQIVTAVDL
jgi:hypothetical protein